MTEGWLAVLYIREPAGQRAFSTLAVQLQQETDCDTHIYTNAVTVQRMKQHGLQGDLNETSLSWSVVLETTCLPDVSPVQPVRSFS